MLGFYLRRVLRSVRRTPVFSAVMIIDVALGLAVWIIAFTAVDAHTRVDSRRAPHVYHVDWGSAPDYAYRQLDSYGRVLALMPHMLLSYRDAARLAHHPAVARSARTFVSSLVLQTPRGPQPIEARFCSRELFAMFGLPFEQGRAFSAHEERVAANVMVLDAQSRAVLFGDHAGVGRSLTIDGHSYKVTGVLGRKPSELRGYDFSIENLPAVYLPFDAFAALGARPKYASRAPRDDHSMQDLLASKEAFVQLWVELPDEARRSAYAAFVEQSARERGIAGAGTRPVLMSPASWAKKSVPISGGFLVFELCALLALLACSVNLSRLLIVKLVGRAPELALQRALGAPRGAVIAQHLLEAVLVSAVATGLGLGIAALGLIGINSIFPDRPVEFTIDASGVLLACAAGLGAALFAGVLPALRMCRAAPASRLRLQ